MTDDAPDTTVEDRLAGALRDRAATTVVSPDGWERIEERVAGRRRRRIALGWVAAPALVAAVVGVLLAVGAVGGGGPEPSVTAGPAGPAYFTLQDLDGRFVLRSAEVRGPVGSVPGAVLRAYGRRAADGLAVDATIVVVTMPAEGDAAMQFPGEPVSVGGRQVTVRSSENSTTVTWREADDRFVNVEGQRVAREDVLSVVGAVDVGADGARATKLPVGFDELYAGGLRDGPENLAERATRQVWLNPEADGDGAIPGVALAVYEGSGLSLDAIAWTRPGARRSQVAGQPALFDPRVGELTWMPRPGVLLTLAADGMWAAFGSAVSVDAEGSSAAATTPPPPPGFPPRFSEGELLELADRVEEVDEATWDRLVAGLPKPMPGRDRSRPDDVDRQVLATDVDGGWTASAYLSGDQVCVEVTYDDGASGSCGSAEVGPTEISGVGVGSEGFVTVTVGKEVAEVVVELSGREPATVATLTSPTLPAAFALFRLPDGATPTLVIARDAGGREVARQTLAPPAPPPPPTAPSRTPTPPLPPTTAAP